MYIFDIVITNNKIDTTFFAEKCVSYAYTLGKRGQILQRHHIAILRENTVTITVLCPEKEALDSKNNDDFVSKQLQELQKSGTVNYVFKGIDETEYHNYQIPKKSDFYVLYFGRSSPLVCGETFNGIPFYKHNFSISFIEEILSWNRNYKSLFNLWLQGDYENFAEEELQNVHSKINKRGREICKEIELQTGISTYYFLFNNRSLTLAEDLARKCPITKEEWSLPNTTSEDFIAFKCTESRLVSELSKNCINL